MSKRINCFRLAAILAVGLFLLTECTKDPNYSQQNLDKIDASVYLFTNGVSFPVGKTEPITIENALKMGESGLDTLFKKDAKGNYSIGADGSQNLDEVISELHLEKLGNLNGVTIQIDTTYKVVEAGPFSTKAAPSLQSIDISKSLNTEWKDIVILDETILSKFPKEIKSIEEALLEGVNANIEIKFSGLPAINGKYLLKDTKIELPSFIFGENDKHVLVLDDEIEIANGTAVVQTATIDKLANIALAGKTEIRGDIKFTSTLCVQQTTPVITSLNSDIRTDIKIGLGNGSDASHPGKIVISRASVKIGYNVEQGMSVSFGEIAPEFQDESVNLALNPEMHISLVTNFGAPIKSDFVMTPYIGGKAQESVTVKGIEMPYSDNWQKTKTNKYAIGSKVTASADETVISTDLSPLLRRIPDSIAVAVKVGVDDNDICTIFPAATYSCNMDYSFKVPISFGNDFNFSFTSDSEITEGTGSFLKRVNVFQIKGDYETTIPLGVNMEITLLDANDREIALKEPIKLNLEASADGKWPKEGEIVAVLAPTEPEKADPRKLRFNYRLNPSAGVNLAADQYIKLDNLKIVLPAGIKIDATEE